MSMGNMNAASSAAADAAKQDNQTRRPEVPVRLIRGGNEDIAIGENSLLEGSFETQGSIFVDGAAVNADLRASQLSIGASGRVEGQASVLRAEIAGVFDGTLECSGEVILRSSSRIAGEVKMREAGHASRRCHRCADTCHRRQRRGRGEVSARCRHRPGRAGIRHPSMDAAALQAGDPDDVRCGAFARPGGARRADFLRRAPALIEAGLFERMLLSFGEGLCGEASP